MKSLSIWFMLPRMNVGGAEKHVLLLASKLKARGFSVGIVTLFEKGTLQKEIEASNIKLVSLDQRSWSLFTFFRIYRWIRSEQIDILHTYLFGFHLFAGFPAWLCKVPVILSSRRELAHWQKKRHLWVEKLGNLFVNQVVCCSDAARRWAVKKENLRPTKTLTIYNGVDLSRFQKDSMDNFRKKYKIPDSAKIIGTVANFSYEKGYPYLLEAVERIHLKRPDVWVLLVGAGPLFDEMKERAERMHRREQIIFTGSRSDVVELMSEMDVFMLSSVIEGFPNVLLEAMALGCPVVATEVGGIPELVESGMDGVLVNPRNSKELSARVLELLEDEKKAELLGAEAAQKIRKMFSIEKMVREYEFIYRGLMDKPGPDFSKHFEEVVTQRKLEPTNVGRGA